MDIDRQEVITVFLFQTEYVSFSTAWSSCTTICLYSWAMATEWSHIERVGLERPYSSIFLVRITFPKSRWPHNQTKGDSGLLYTLLLVLIDKLIITFAEGSCRHLPTIWRQNLHTWSPAWDFIHWRSMFQYQQGVPERFFLQWMWCTTSFPIRNSFATTYSSVALLSKLSSECSFLTHKPYALQSLLLLEQCHSTCSATTTTNCTWRMPSTCCF